MRWTFVPSYSRFVSKVSSSVPVAMDWCGGIVEELCNSALANQAANGRPVSKNSKASLGNCTNSGSAAEFTKYRARQR
jgi:hypothetical protein